MKKFTLIALAALMSATTMMAVPVKKDIQKAFRPVKNVTLQNAKHSLGFMQDQEMRTAWQQFVANQPVQKAPVYDEPTVTYYNNMFREGAFYYLYWGMFLVNGSTDNSVGQVVEGTNGELYIYNAISQLGANSYVKAAKVDDDGHYAIKKQLIYYAAGEYNGEEYVDEYYATPMEYVEYEDENGELQRTFMELDEDIPVTWKDGVLTVDGDYNWDWTADGAVPEGAKVIGMQIIENGEDYGWQGYADWNIKFSVNNETYTELPAGVVADDTWAISYKTDGAPAAEYVSVAFDGDDFYFKPVNNDYPGWIKGSKGEDGRIFIPAGQYLGAGSVYNYHFFNHVSTSELLYDEDYEEYYDGNFHLIAGIVFDIDEAAQKLTIYRQNAYEGESVGLSIDAAKNRVYYINLFNDPTIYKWVEEAVKPATPNIRYWGFNTYAEDMENFDANIPVSGANGELILPEKLYWQVYADNEVFTFTPDDDPALTEDMTEIPYGFRTYNLIGGAYGQTDTYLPLQVSENIGVQSIYYGADVRKVSDIYFYWVNENAYSIEEGNDDIATRVEGIASGKVAGEAYYDVAGRKVAADAKGFVVKTVTFADGSQKSYKVVRK